MNRFKLFIENFLVYGLGSVMSKIIPIIMLPIVTRLMPNTYFFGLNDISTVVVSFGTAIAIMGIYDAMYRMFFDKEEQEFKKDICSSALAFTIITSILVFAVLVIFRDLFTQLFFGDIMYKNLLLLSAMSVLIGSTNTIIAAPTRMNNNRKIYLITNTLSSLVSYAISIPLLLNGYFVIALPLSSVISAITIEIIFGVLNRHWFSFKRVRWDYIKQMLIIALPLLPNFLIYWLFNSCDRLMIASMLGNEFVGIYAIGSKVGQMSNLLYAAFAGGWQYFAFSTMKDNDQVKLTSNIFEYLGLLTFGAGMIVAALSQWIFKSVFIGEYQLGACVAPYLFVAPLLLMLFQVACNQFIVIKKTWPNLLILSSGAIINILVNWLGIRIIGIEGAALGTLVGYAISVIVCVLVLEKMNMIEISKKFKVSVLVVCVYAVIWRFFMKDHVGLSLVMALLGCGLFVLLYIQDILKIKRK